MDEEFAVLLFFFGIASTACLGFAVAWFRANRRIRQLEGRQFEGRAPGYAQVEDDRSERIERSLEALAGQVDQLANGQEFLNRLLSERGKSSRPLPVEREVTPH